MFQNDNRAITKRLTKRSLQSNKMRNFFIIAAITLTTLLLASVFSIGMSILDSQKMQQVRLMGTAAHAAISNPSLHEMEQLKNLDYVKTIGTGNHIAPVNSTQQMGDMVLSLHYFDKTEWRELRLPACTDIVGNYPQKRNEIMVPYWVLEKLGIDPEIGAEISLSYTVETDGEYKRYDEVFILSGWFTSYMHIRSGNIDSILVSEELSSEYDRTVESYGAAAILFSDGSNVNEYCERLEHDLGISDTQRVRAVPMYDSSNADNTPTFIALLFVIAFLILVGYLLIYNVLYISVSRDVRFYGLLKTIGTTPRQIRRIVTGQIVRLCVIGIPLGMALASLLSLVIVPALVSGMGTLATGTVVSFSPIIFIGAAFFALLTAFLGAARPAKKAAGVSPVEAQKYTGTEVRKNAVHSLAHGKPYKMAVRNIFRDRKRAIVVLLSLFLGVTTFIAVTTLVASMDTDNYVASYVENDFMLTNNTIDGDNKPEQKFDNAFIEALKNIPGLESVQYDTKGMFTLTYTNDFDEYIATTLNDNLTAEDLAAVKNNFTCIAVGVDGAALSELDSGFDMDAFANGEYLLLAAGDPSLLEGIESVEIRSWPGGDVISTVPVGGFVPQHFHSDSFSVAPTLIMSNALMDKLTGGAIRSNLHIDVAEGYEAQFLDALKTLTEGDYEISRESKIEARESLRDAKMTLYILGGGVALVLGLIGVLNFVNVMSVGIIVRKREFATLESVGMSREQIRGILLFEGMGYALLTLLLVSTLGNLVAYGLFKLFQQQATYAIFTYPVIPVMITVSAILAVCIITPAIAYRAIAKTTIVERLREAE
jgi:putative ABC transport system permease protein